MQLLYYRPLVSIIIPLFNAEKYISEALDSVFLQTYENWECIIVDDGSTDGSSKIAMDFCTKSSRFHYHRQRNGGPSHARNTGFQRSQGEFIQYLDADDVLFPKRLETLLGIYSNIREKIILYTDFLVGDNDDINKTTKVNYRTSLGEDIDFNSMYKLFQTDILFMPGCILFPREAVTGIKWDESISHSEDWDYYLKITKHSGYQFRNVPTILFTYRNTQNSLSTNLRSNYKASYQIIERYRNPKNIPVYCKKSGCILYSNLLNYRKKRISTIVVPYNFRKIESLFSLILFPFTLFFCISFYFTLKR